MTEKQKKLTQPDRRGFLSALAEELRDRGQGKEIRYLDELGSLDDSILTEMIPKLLEPNQLEQQDASDREVLLRFNGETSLRECSEALVRQTGGSRVETWKRVKGVFLTAVDAGVCTPNNLPQLLG